MPFDRTTIQKLTAHDAPDWIQVGEHPAYVGYLADEAEGSEMGLAYIRFRKGVTFEFLWAYDEVAPPESDIKLVSSDVVWTG